MGPVSTPCGTRTTADETTDAASSLTHGSQVEQLVGLGLPGERSLDRVDYTRRTTVAREVGSYSNYKLPGKNNSYFSRPELSVPARISFVVIIACHLRCPAPSAVSCTICGKGSVLRTPVVMGFLAKLRRVLPARCALSLLSSCSE